MAERQTRTPEAVTLLTCECGFVASSAGGHGRGCTAKAWRSVEYVPRPSGQEPPRDPSEADWQGGYIAGWDAARKLYEPVALPSEEALREAGEAMFRELAANLGCGHVDPRHPRHEDCPYCRAKGRAMDRWDAALRAAAQARRDEGESWEAGYEAGWDAATKRHCAGLPPIPGEGWVKVSDLARWLTGEDVAGAIRQDGDSPNTLARRLVGWVQRWAAEARSNDDERSRER